MTSIILMLLIGTIQVIIYYYMTITLEDLKDAWRNTVTGYTATTINQFEVGENFDTNKFADSSNYYPLAFLEIPYSITYDKKNRTISFALVILLNSEFDNPRTNHIKISQAETIGDNIIKSFEANYKHIFKIENVNGLSLSQYTDDKTCGMRFEITGTALRNCL